MSPTDSLLHDRPRTQAPATASAGPIVRLDQVFKSFGSNQVLKGVSFEVARGEMVAIIGASGSGKSTALRCIDRLEVIDAGQIINNSIFQPFLIFFLVGSFYFALCYPLSRWSEAMEKKLNVANH